ncbi:MAG TPA: ketose-bisphosphate aldolase [Planctomycetota bacterium]|nr:ketose-bisphosphate aldolase [Planctomycetota bacterium]
MPLTPMRQILDEAKKIGYGVGAYNVNNMEQIQAIMKAAKDTQSPVILQASRGALEYTSMVYLKHLMLAAVEENPDIPLAMHLDHGPNLEVCKEAIALGFTSVMIDGSIDYDVKDAKGKHPARTFEDNIRVTKEVVDFAHTLGVSVEGELGTLGGIEEDTVASEVLLTDPEQAVEFVQKTGVDALALAIGTSHGAYKFKHEPKLAMDLIDGVRKNVPKTALVMHGSSSVPAELVDQVNKYGGKLDKTMGVPIPSIQEAIKRGVTKINVDTDGRLAYTGALRKFLAENPKEFDQRKYLGYGRTAIYNVIKSKMIDFGTANHAKDYKPMSLADMKKFYGR